MTPVASLYQFPLPELPAPLCTAHPSTSPKRRAFRYKPLKTPGPPEAALDMQFFSFHPLPRTIFHPKLLWILRLKPCISMLPQRSDIPFSQPNLILNQNKLFLSTKPAYQPAYQLSYLGIGRFAPSTQAPRPRTPQPPTFSPQHL